MPRAIRRLPAAPLKRELRRIRRQRFITWNELASDLGISSRTIQRLLVAREITERLADHVACRLGLHPALVWPRQWSRTDAVHEESTRS